MRLGCPRPPGSGLRPTTLPAAARLAIPLVLALATLAPPAGAQALFGKNKVQYSDFEWRVMETPHVDLHFYPEETELAEWVAAVAEEATVELMAEMRLDTTRTVKRVPFLLYSTHRDFEQTNVSPYLIPEEVGGLTDLIKGRVLVPHTGSYHRLRWVVRHELVHALMLEKLSQVLREHKKTRYTYPPLWYVEGLAEFLGSAGLDARADMVLRDAVINDHLVPIGDLWQINGSFQMYKQGQSILYHIEEEYGREKVLEFLFSWWKKESFDELVFEVLGVTVDELNREWTDKLRLHYFPQVKDRDAVDVKAVRMVEHGAFNLKACPVPPREPGDDGTRTEDPAGEEQRADGEGRAGDGGNSAAGDEGLPGGDEDLELVHLSSFGGFAGLRHSHYRAGVPPREGPAPQLLVKGGTSETFESLHFFESAIDVNANREVVFVAKAGARDVLHIVDVDQRRLTATLDFPELVSLGSPGWSPDGNEIVVSGVAVSGFRDLYVVGRDGSGLRALTNDHYDDRDPDWSPNGSQIVFSSDRCPDGDRGAYNLYLLDVASERITPLTHGRQEDAQPVFSPDGRWIAFRSDRRDLCYELYVTDLAGVVQPLLRLQTGILDPEWTPDGRHILFTTFVDRSFAVYRAPVPELEPPTPPAGPMLAQRLDDPGSFPTLDDFDEIVLPAADDENREPNVRETSVSVEPLPEERVRAPVDGWHPAAPDSSYPITGYRRRFGLDLIQGGVAFDPDFGGGGGGQIAFSDLLGNEQLLFFLANDGGGSSGGGFLDSFDVGFTYFNVARRLNWGVGAFRLARTYNADLDLFRRESRIGGLFIASYPLSKFHRIETSLVVRRISNHLYRSGVEDDTFFISNLFSYVHDTTLWSPIGPFDGSRYNITLGLTTDIGAGLGDYTSLLGDYRRYFRLGRDVVYAARATGLFSFGAEGQRYFIGGAYTLRGYPRRSVNGQRLVLINNELRFPLIQRMVLRMPMGGVDMPVFYGALFVDAAWAGDPKWTERPYGSLGFGIFVGGGGLPRLRIDFSRRTDFSSISDRTDTEFSIGFNF